MFLDFRLIGSGRITACRVGLRPGLYGMVISGRCAPQHIKFNIKSTALYRIKWFNTFESQNILL
jgi:hypothetical protein